MALTPFLGDFRDEIREETRDWLLFVDLVSSILRFAGRDFSIFFGGVSWRCGGDMGTGPVLCNCAGGGISFGIIPCAFASSCAITWAYISSKSRFNISRSASTIRVSTYGSPEAVGVRGDFRLGGKMYGFLISFSGEGQEKFREPPGDERPAESGPCGVGCAVSKRGSTISISSALGETWIWCRSLRPRQIRPMPTMQTEKRYAPMMPPIWAGRRALSLEADADRGGPSAGGGAGLHQMFNGLCLGTSVRMLAELIVRLVNSRITGAWIVVSAQTCMVVLLCREGEASSFYSVVAGRRNVVRYRGSMELSL
jgi:hypothetical protein